MEIQKIASDISKETGMDINEIIEKTKLDIKKKEIKKMKAQLLRLIAESNNPLDVPVEEPKKRGRKKSEIAS